MTWELILQLGTLSAGIGGITFGINAMGRAKAAAAKREGEERSKIEVSLATLDGRLEGVVKETTGISRDIKDISSSINRTHIDVVEIRSAVNNMGTQLATVEHDVRVHDVAIRELEAKVAELSARKELVND